MATQEQQTWKQRLDEAFERLERVYQEEVDAYQAKIDELQAQVEALQAKLNVETDAKTDDRIRKLAERDQISFQAWIARELKLAADMADQPFIRVDSEFYDRLWRLAEAKGVMPVTLTTSHEMTQRLIWLIDNQMI